MSNYSGIIPAQESVPVGVCGCSGTVPVSPTQKRGSYWRAFVKGFTTEMPFREVTQSNERVGGQGNKGENEAAFEKERKKKAS